MLQGVLMPCPWNTPRQEAVLLTVNGCYDERECSRSVPPAVLMARGADQKHSAGKISVKQVFSCADLSLLRSGPRWPKATSLLHLFGQTSGLGLPWGHTNRAMWPDSVQTKVPQKGSQLQVSPPMLSFSFTIYEPSFYNVCLLKVENKC